MKKIEIYGRLLKNGHQVIYLNCSVNFMFGKNGSGKTYILKKIFEDTKTKLYEKKTSKWKLAKNKLSLYKCYTNNTHFYNSFNNIFYFNHTEFSNIFVRQLNENKDGYIASYFKSFNYKKYDKVCKIELDKKIKDLQSKTNKVFQKYVPFINLSFSPDIFFSPRSTKDGGRTRVISSVKISFTSRTNLESISSGERILASIILYMLQIPSKKSLIILDEPFIHLHSSLIKDLISFFEWLCKELQVTFLISSHDITALKHWEFYNSMGVEKVENSKIRIENSYNSDKMANLENQKIFLKNIPSIVSHFTFSEVLSTFFTDQIIIVEGISDKFYLDSILKGRKQVIAANGNGEIIKTIHQVAWHCKELKILCDGDIKKHKKLFDSIRNETDNLKKIFKFKFEVKTTDDFCKFCESDIERIMLDRDGHEMSYSQKLQCALSYATESTECKNISFVSWLCSDIK